MPIYTTIIDTNTLVNNFAPKGSAGTLALVWVPSESATYCVVCWADEPELPKIGDVLELNGLPAEIVDVANNYCIVELFTRLRQNRYPSRRARRELYLLKQGIPNKGWSELGSIVKIIGDPVDYSGLAEEPQASAIRNLILQVM